MDKNKPISIIVEETRQQIADLLNSFHMSPTILEPIIKDIYREVHEAHQAEYQKDMIEYKKTQNND